MQPQDNPTPPVSSGNQPATSIDRYQLTRDRIIAEQRITAALTEFAHTLPDGMRHLQSAIDGMSAVLDNLERATGQFNDPLAAGPPPGRWDTNVAEEERVAGVEESEEIKDFDQS
jgi:hypothetical protein